MLEQIKNAVIETSHIMLEAADGEIDTLSKEGHANFVTKYDSRVQKELFDRLAEILPEAKFMGEEDNASSSFTGKGYLFIIDPIDGTTNFIRQNQASCISVGLLKDGESVLGVVYNPYKKELFYAEKGKGAFRNGTPIRVSEEPLSNSILLFGTSPYYEELARPAFDIAYHYFRKCLDLRRSGSAAIDLCDIACGRADLYFELRLSPWDYAAGSLIIKEAGGHIHGCGQTALQFEHPQSIIAYGKGITSEDLSYFPTFF
ncbi:MAG: inositol monophosphatase [Ruminococcus sp.]|nr:inositol monophosphatase [Ruminococcus sp.]